MTVRAHRALPPVAVLLLALLLVAVALALPALTAVSTAPLSPAAAASSTAPAGDPPAQLAAGLLDRAPSQSSSTPTLVLVETLTVKGRAPMTGYDRSDFGPTWADVDGNGCDTRNDMLRRDLTGETFRPGTDGCVVLTGRLVDPYTRRVIAFSKQRASAVQIDHVVALADAWQKGARQWPAAKRRAFANDPLNLLAVDGPTNQRKGSADAATWLPPNVAYRCRFVARQVAVKARYDASVTPAEKAAFARVLHTCPATLTAPEAG